AQTAPPTVPGMARPNSSPVRPASLVTVAARAIGRPESAVNRLPSIRSCCARLSTTSPRMPASLITRSEPRPTTNRGIARDRAQLEQVVHFCEQVRGTTDTHRGEAGKGFAPRGLDADAALDLGAESERVRFAQLVRGLHRETHACSGPAAMRSMRAASGMAR